MTTTLLAHAPAGLTVRHAAAGTHAATNLAGHDDVRHQALDADPDRFCGRSVAVTDLTVTRDSGRQLIRVTTAPAAYCRLQQRRAAGPGPAASADRPWTFGFNVTVSVGPGDRQMIVARRAEQLSFGGRWHVAANEGADPADLPAASPAARVPERTSVPVDVVAATRRALVEELGLDVSARHLAQVTVAHRLLSVDGHGAYALAAHVRLGALGFTAADVHGAHQRAADGWEATELAVVDATRSGLDRLEGPWTPWARACFDGALDVLDHPHVGRAEAADLAAA